MKKFVFDKKLRSQKIFHAKNHNTLLLETSNCILIFDTKPIIIQSIHTRMMPSLLKFAILSLLLTFALCEKIYSTELHAVRYCALTDDTHCSTGSVSNLITSLDKPTPIGGNSNSNSLSQALAVPRGGIWFPAGYHPYGYGLTELAQEFLKFEGSLDSDIGRFLASLKSGRKKKAVLKEQWIEVVRVSKTRQSMRILRTLDDIIEFCMKVGFIN